MKIIICIIVGVITVGSITTASILIDTTKTELLINETKTSLVINASQTGKLTEGLVGMWSFDGPDVYGTTAIDRSGEGNNGTLTNGPIESIGKIGQGLKFDGVDSYVRVDNLVNNTGESTYSFWVYLNGAQSDYTGLLTAADVPVNPYMFVRNSNELYVYHYGSAGAIDCRTWGMVIPMNEWAHILTRQDSTGCYNYINNTLVGSDTSVTGSWAETAGGLWFGSERGNRGRYLDGTMDEIRIYNRFLSREEITRLYNMGK